MGSSGLGCSKRRAPTTPTLPSAIRGVLPLIPTQGLLCSSFLVMTSYLVGAYHILPEKELHRSPQVEGPVGVPLYRLGPKITSGIAFGT